MPRHASCASPVGQREICKKLKIKAEKTKKKQSLKRQIMQSTNELHQDAKDWKKYLFQRETGKFVYGD